MKKYLFILLLTYVLFLGCEKKDNSSLDKNFTWQCNVEKQEIKATLNSGGINSEVSSAKTIVVKKGDKISFIVPDNTQAIIRELCASNKYTNQSLDTEINLIDEYTPGKEFTIDLGDEEANSVVRYFLCSANNAATNPSSCYPSCYQARLYIEITE